MKNLASFILFILLNLLTFNQVQAGCAPAFMKKTIPQAGSFLLSDNKISFTFLGGGGTQQVVGGNIKLYKSANDSLIETIAITSVYPVGSYGNVDGAFEFIISKKLEANTQYYVLIDSGSFACRDFVFDFIRDSTGNPFVWNFTTASSPVTINYSGAVNFCQGETATLSVLKCFSYLWSTGETTQTIVVKHPGIYSVKVVYMNGTSATNSISISGKQPNSVPICYVSVDSLSQNNIIRWDKSNLSVVDSFIVYREITTNNYQPVGAVSYKAASMFTDTARTKYFPNTGNPNAGTYRYKLQVRDTCGNYSALSPYHNTIYMNNNNGTFSWIQLYNIEGAANPVNAYVLMRDDNSDGNWHAINSVTGTQYTVTDPAYSNFKNTARWRIETLWGISCGQAAKVKGSTASNTTISRSNAISALNADIPAVTTANILKIYPNPSKGKFIVEVKDELNANIKVFSILGELIYEQNAAKGINSIDLTASSANIYFVQVKCGEKVYQQKLVLTE